MILTLEQIILDRSSKEEKIAFLKTNPDQFDTAVRFILSAEHPVAWRTAWVLNHYMADNDMRLQPHLDALIKVIPNQKDGFQREVLKILTKMKLNDEQEGRLFDTCVSIWEAVNKSPSVRYTAFRHIATIAKKYPDLKNELEFFMQEHYTHSLSPGIKRSLMKMIGKRGKKQVDDKQQFSV